MEAERNSSRTEQEHSKDRQKGQQLTHSGISVAELGGLRVVEGGATTVFAGDLRT